MTRKGRTGRKSNTSRRKRAQKRLFSLERGLFTAVSKGLFALGFLVLIYIGLASNLVFVAALAGIGIFLWGAVALPVDAFQDFGAYLWDGKFGEDLHGLWDALIPWDRRGQTDTRTFATLAVLVIVLALILIAATPGIAVAQSDDDEFTPTQDCSTTVYYDEFRTAESVVDEANTTGSATVTKQNTRVRLNDSDAFYRVHATNPNSYCVEMTVEISGAVLPPASLGEVNNIEETTAARWTDIHSFEDQSAFTELTFSVPANTTVTFAPSKPTVFLPAWRDERKRDAEGVLDRLKGSLPFSEEDPLKKHVYKFNGTSDSVTVRLDNPGKTGEAITEWNAVYRLSEDEPWKPVDTNTNDPVYYRELGSDRVKFVMDDESAVVEFRANPTTTDEILDEFRSYRSSWDDLGSLWPFALVPTGVTG